MITLRVTTEDGTELFTGKSLPRDLLAWELSSPKRSISDFKENQRYADIYEIAWLLARRKGHVPREFPLSDFMKEYDVEPVGTSEEEAAKETAAGFMFARRHGLIDPELTVSDFIRDYPEIPEDQLGDPVGDPKSSSPEVSGTH